jgi:cell division protein FtsB
MIKNRAILLQAEGDAADARREVATLERDNVKLAATNRQLVRRVEELECHQSGAAATES